MKICLDAGHGGSDPGAVGGTLFEKTCTLSMMKKLKAYLERRGVTVILTREKDEYVSLSKRTSIANRENADLFISIHTNSATNSAASGIETLCFSIPSEGGSLAARVQQALIEASGWKNRGVKERSDLAVLRGTDMPAILMEVGFISNSEEREKIASEEMQEKLMCAVADSIFQEEKPVEEKVMYHTIEEIPQWGRKTAEYLVKKGVLVGDGEDLRLTEEMLRIFVVLERLQLIGE